MSSDLEIAVQYLDYVLQWVSTLRREKCVCLLNVRLKYLHIQFISWLQGCPFAVLLIVINIIGIFITWRLLTWKTIPPTLKTSNTSLMLLMMIVLVLLRSYNMSNELIELEKELDNAKISIRKGLVQKESLDGIH